MTTASAGTSSFGRRFLAAPDLFPRRRSGPRWGERSLLLDLPGGPFRLDGLDETQLVQLTRRWGALARALDRPPGNDSAVAKPVPVPLFRAHGEDFLAVDTRGWEYSLDLDPEPEGVRVAGLGLMARVDLPAAGPASAALWTDRPEGGAFGDAVENVLRLLLAHRLLQRGGVLLHAAAVVDGDGARALYGPSGIGKTTASRLARSAGLPVLSDDLCAIDRPTPGGPPTVEAIPFAGDLWDEIGAAPGPRSSHPLIGLHRLGRLDGEDGEDGAAGPRRTPLSTAEACASLAAACPFVAADPHRAGRLLEVLGDLVVECAAERLAFRREGPLFPLPSPSPSPLSPSHPPLPPEDEP